MYPTKSCYKTFCESRQFMAKKHLHEKSTKNMGNSVTIHFFVILAAGIRL